MREDAVDAHRRALRKIFLRTSQAAYRLKPYSDVPPRSADALLDFGERQTDFCRCKADCKTHSVGAEAFRALPERRMALILEHFSSCWLDESREYIGKMHQKFLIESCATASRRTIDIVRGFFGFNLSMTPAIFSAWVGRVFGREVQWLEKRMAVGWPSGPLKEWAEIAASLAGVFRRELELELKELPTVPETTLTEFENFAGSLYNDALQKSPKHRVSKDALLSIADRLDKSTFIPPEPYLEHAFRAELARHNQRVGIKGEMLNTWCKLASNPRFQAGMRRRLIHAAQKFRNSLYGRPSAPSF
jgi:hypothetical protein